MSLHVFANVVTPFGTAANNRGETEGNVTTLQKLIWRGDSHTTVSAETIRFALRRLLADAEPGGTNRRYDERTRINGWQDAKFAQWADEKLSGFIDDDLMGFMSAEAAKEEGGKGAANVRRAVLEIARAVSLTPWHGDVMFNAASPNATAAAAKGEGANPVPYMAEIHATRYQFGLAMTPTRLRVRSRAVAALKAIGFLSEVAGNQARFLFDFSPDAIVLRVTEDPAPRLLYCFETDDDGKTVTAPVLVARIKSGDVDPKELVLGCTDENAELRDRLRDAGIEEIHGVKRAIELACERMSVHADMKEA